MKISELLEIISELEAKYPERKFYFDAAEYAIVSEPKD